MSLQDEPIRVELVNPPEPPEGQKPVESMVKHQIVCQIKIEQSAAVQNSITGAVVAGRDAALNESGCSAVVAGGHIRFTDSVGVVTVAGGKADITNSKAGLLISRFHPLNRVPLGFCLPLRPPWERV